MYGSGLLSPLQRGRKMLESIVELYEPITTKTSDGTLKKVYGYQGSCGGIWDDTQVWTDTQLWLDGSDSVIVTDVQPKSLTEAQLKQWGLSTLSQDAKVIYDFNNNSYFKLGNRARVDYGTVYDIRAINNWESHGEYILLPIQGQ